MADALAAPPAPPTGASQAELDALWVQLLTSGQKEMYDWMQRRVPPELMPHFNYYWDAHSNNPDAATVANGDQIMIRDGNGQVMATGTAVVANSILTHLTVPVAGAIVKNGDTIPIQYSGGQVIQGSPAVATVNGLSQLVFARLSVAQAAMVRNSDSVNVIDLATNVVPGSPGVANVVGQTFTQVQLTA